MTDQQRVADVTVVGELALMSGRSSEPQVVGSNPTRSIFINLDNYCINLSSFLIIVGQNPPLQKLSISVSYATDDGQKITKKEFN
jgi:hypothetical protein